MKCFFTLLLAGSSLASFSKSTKPPVKVLSAKDGFFYFMTLGKSKGALVHVYDSTHQLVAKTTMTRNKLLIDFYEAVPGSYQIEISLLDTKLSFEYVLADDRTSDDTTGHATKVSFF